MFLKRMLNVFGKKKSYSPIEIDVCSSWAIYGTSAISRTNSHKINNEIIHFSEVVIYIY